MDLRAQLETSHAASFAWALNCCAWDHAEAEEVLQTVYVKVLQGKAVYNGRAAFRTWLFSVIRNTARGRRRWNLLRRRRVLPLHEPSPAADSRPGPAEAAVDRQVAARLRTALAALPRRQREVLHLVFYQDLSVADAAAVIGVSVGSARTHYERGKRQLRRLMEAP